MIREVLVTTAAAAVAPVVVPVSVLVRAVAFLGVVAVILKARRPG